MARKKLGDRVFGHDLLSKVAALSEVLVWSGWLLACALAAIAFAAVVLAGAIGGRFGLKYEAVSTIVFSKIRFSPVPEYIALAAAVLLAILLIIRGGRVLLNGVSEIRRSL